MLHPSYTDLMKVVNSGVEIGEEPVVNSRYSIVLATAKRARQIISGDKPLVEEADGKKAFSVAVEELYKGKVKILSDEEVLEEVAAEAAEDITETLTEEETVAEDVSEAVEEEISPEE